MSRFLFALLALLAFPALAEPSIRVAFSPNGEATDAVVGVIREAKNTIQVAAYSFTSRPIAEALVTASRRGVDVRVVLDKSNETGRYSAATFLTNQGMPVRIHGKHAIMHHKFLIIDEKTVQTGSFNYSRAAERQPENVLILRDHPEVASRYLAEWNRLWREGRDFRK